MTFQIKKIKEILKRKILEKASLKDGEIDIIIEHYLIAELAGIKTHGLSKLFWDMNFFPQAIGAVPEILKKDKETLFVNMNGMIGALGVEWMVNELGRSKKRFAHYQNLLPFGALFSVAYKLINSLKFSVVLFNNTDRFMRLKGGRDTVGTNPLCFAFASNPPVIFDMATSKKSMSYAFAMKERGNDRKNTLPKETYLDEKGFFTRDPFRAKYVVPAGNYKGYGLGFMIELFTKFLFPQKTATHSSGKFLCNGAILTIDSSGYDSLEFKKYLLSLSDGYPGDKNMDNLNKSLLRGTINIEDDAIIEKLGLS